MENKTFRAMVVRELPDKSYERTIGQKNIDDLPQGDMLIRVMYSSLNYKDALSAVGNRGVTRHYPHTPGIDASGIVEESQTGSFSSGDKVIVTSYDLGMNTSGGFGRYIRVPAAWAVPLPHALSLRESMIYGTAGFTAGLSLYYLESSVQADQGDILVTGASGGVGSLAVAILAKCGYSVTAATGKPSETEYLLSLGAKKVIDRQELVDADNKPLLKSRWAGVVDTVGGSILATAIKSTHPHGIVTSCGNVASADLSLNVYPFIIRGIRLQGIDSQNCPMPIRRRIWENLADTWKIDSLEALCTEISLEQLDEHIRTILKGQQRGRVLVNLEES